VTGTEAQILRYYHAERWRIGTIAVQLGLHRDTVARVLAQAGLPRHGPVQRASAIDPYLPFIHETLAQFPRLTAARLYDMVRARGYPGRPDHFRHLIARHRPRPSAEAYLRLRTLPGEQAQVDWGHFGHLTIGRARRPLMAFVMVLSWSRQIYLRFFLDARMENFLRGHVGAFAHWGAVPRIALYDNLKSAVLERCGNAIRFHPTLLALAGHYRFEPRPVAVARGNEKGRVERAIRYVREAFFAGRPFADLDDLNAQAQAWCEGAAGARRCPEDASMTVAEAFAAERERLLALPEAPFPTDELRAVSAGKTPYVRFDLNDYSIPHTHVQRPLTVCADPLRVRILEPGVARPGCWPGSESGGDHGGAAAFARSLRRERVAGGHRGGSGPSGAAPERGASGTGAPARDHRPTATGRNLLARACAAPRYARPAAPAGAL
jgi:transposase